MELSLILLLVVVVEVVVDADAVVAVVVDVAVSGLKDDKSDDLFTAAVVDNLAVVEE